MVKETVFILFTMLTTGILAGMYITEAAKGKETGDYALLFVIGIALAVIAVGSAFDAADVIRVMITGSP